MNMGALADELWGPPEKELEVAMAMLSSLSEWK